MVVTIKMFHSAREENDYEYKAFMDFETIGYHYIDSATMVSGSFSINGMAFDTATKDQATYIVNEFMDHMDDISNFKLSRVDIECHAKEKTATVNWVYKNHAAKEV